MIKKKIQTSNRRCARVLSPPPVLLSNEYILLDKNKQYDKFGFLFKASSYVVQRTMMALLLTLASSRVNSFNGDKEAGGWPDSRSNDLVDASFT